MDVEELRRIGRERTRRYRERKRQGVPPPLHRLKEVNLDTRTAICAICGPAPIIKHGVVNGVQYWMCGIKYKAIHNACDSKRYRDVYPKFRELVFQHYGDKCCRCGHEDKRALEIDHVEGGGHQHRKSLKKQGGGWGICQWLVRNNFPPGYRVLCRNCNWIAYLERKEAAS